MPAQPRWISKINDIAAELEALPRPFVDRATVSLLLGVGRRRAQQIMAPAVTDHVGTNGLAGRAALLAHLRRLAAGEDPQYELERRRQVAGRIADLRRERLERPQVLVEAPVRILAQQFASLPEGVTLEAGQITVRFSAPREALEKLLALAMAIGNDFAGFENLVGPGRV